MNKIMPGEVRLPIIATAAVILAQTSTIAALPLSDRRRKRMADDLIETRHPTQPAIRASGGAHP